MKVKAIWEFDADVSDISPEYVDVEGWAKELTKNELNTMLLNFELSGEDFQFETETETFAKKWAGKIINDIIRETALDVLKELSRDMYHSNDIYGHKTLVMRRKDFEAIRHKYLDNKEAADDHS